MRPTTGIHGPVEDPDNGKQEPSRTYGVLRINLLQSTLLQEESHKRPPSVLLMFQTNCLQNLKSNKREREREARFNLVDGELFETLRQKGVDGVVPFDMEAWSNTTMKFLKR